MFWTPPCLVVQLSHERVGRVVPEDGGVGHVASRRGGGGGRSVLGGGRGEELLRLGDLACQGVGRIALTLPHEGSGAHTSLPLRGGSPCSEESVGEGGGRARQRGSRGSTRGPSRRKTDGGGWKRRDPTDGQGRQQRRLGQASSAEIGGRGLLESAWADT
jgi:hypothetical protein